MAGEEQRTTVLYKAVADFSDLARESRKAKRDLRDLRDEEKRTNDESERGTDRSTRARGRYARAVDNAVDSVRRLSREVRGANQVHEKHTAVMKDNADETERSRHSHRTLGDSVRDLAREVRNAAPDIDRYTRSIRNAGRAHETTTRKTRDHERAMESARRKALAFSNTLDRIGNWRPHLIPPFIALVPIIGGLLAVINPLVAALGAVSVAVFGLGSNLLSIVGVLYAAIPALGGFIATIGAVILATDGLGDAYKAFSKWSESGDPKDLEEYNKALEKLSPSARKFVKNTTAMQDEWKELKKETQESFFAPFVDSVPKLRKLLPDLRDLMSTTASAVGREVDRLITTLSDPSWRRDLKLFGEFNSAAIAKLGEAGSNLLVMFRDLAVISAPFTLSIMEGWRRGSENLKVAAATARETGSLAAWLEIVNSRLSQWWRITKNIGKTLFDYGAAAGPFGQWLTDGFEKLTQQWRENAAAAREEGSPFRQYLEDIKPMLVEVRGFWGDFFRWLKREAMDPDNIRMWTDITKVLRNEVGPALGSVLEILADTGTGDDFFKALGSILSTLDTFLRNGGAEGIKAFWTFASELFIALEGLIKITPEPVLRAIATTFAALAVMEFFGLNTLLRLLLTTAGSPAVKLLMSGLKKLGPLAGGALVAAGQKAGLPKAIVGGGGKRVATKPTPTAPVVAAPVSGRRAAPTAKKFLGGGLKGGLAGIGVALLGDFVLNNVVRDEQGGARDTAASVGSGALTGALLGGTIGTLLGGPGIGTALGAAAGGSIAAGGVDTAQWRKTADEISSWWSGTVVPGFQSASEAVSSWWSGTVVPGFQSAGESVSAWWSESVVPGFTSAADNVGKWWDEKVATPFGETREKIGKWWDEKVATPFGEAKDEFLRDWHENVVTPFNAFTDFIGRMWQVEVLDPWNKHVVEPFEGFVTTVKTAWETRVIQPLEGFILSAQTLWETRVVEPFNGFILSAQMAWDTYVVQPFNGFILAAQTTWDTYVVQPFNGFILAAQVAWDTYVVQPFSGFILAARTAWDTRVVAPFNNFIAAARIAWDTRVVAPFNAFVAAARIMWETRVVAPFNAFVAAARSTWETRVVAPFNGLVAYLKGAWDRALSAIRNFDISDTITRIFNSSYRPKAIGTSSTPKGGMSKGGVVPGRGSGDTVPTMLEPKEFVLRKRVVQRIGTDNLRKLNAGMLSFGDMLSGFQKPQFMSTGGLVPSGVSIASPSFAGGSGRAAGRTAPVIENFIVNNPVPERASDSLYRQSQKLSYLGFGAEG